MSEWDLMYLGRGDHGRRTNAWEWCLTAFLLLLVFGALAMIEVPPVNDQPPLPVSEVTR